MKIIFAGTSHGIPERDRFCSTTFIEINGNIYVIDAGAPISPLLLRYGLRHEDVRGIFVTHFHGDHFEGLPEFCNQITWYYRNAAPEIYLPEQKCVDLLRGWVHMIQRTDHDPLRLHCYQPGTIYRDDLIEIEAIPTRHIPFAHAFRIKAEGKTLLFTGDMSNQYPEFPELLHGLQYDLVVCEGAHNSTIADCSDLFRQADTKHLVINHINPAKLVGIEAVQDTFPFPFTTAYDGYTVQL